MREESGTASSNTVYFGFCANGMVLDGTDVHLQRMVLTE